MKTVVVYSGGLDSTVLLAGCKDAGEQVVAISFMYGQRHSKELSAASAIAHHYGIKHQLADLTGLAHLFAGESSQAGKCDVPDGHYTDETMKRTVVPNRNMIMLALATGYAIQEKAEQVAFGAHAGDHTIYPDCRADFVGAMERALKLCDWHPVALTAPFLGRTKGYVVRLGADLGAPLGMTWSCYKGGEVHCGTCGTCVERREAFQEAEVPDPTVYALSLIHI